MTMRNMPKCYSGYADTYRVEEWLLGQLQIGVAGREYPLDILIDIDTMRRRGVGLYLWGSTGGGTGSIVAPLSADSTRQLMFGRHTDVRDVHLIEVTAVTESGQLWTDSVPVPVAGETSLDLELMRRAAVKVTAE